MCCNRSSRFAGRFLNVFSIVIFFFLAFVFLKGEDDPLLGGSWQGEESKALQGMIFRAKRLLSRDSTGVPLKNTRGDLFFPDPSGTKLIFDPAQEYWKPAVINSEDYVFLVDQADGLIRQGLNIEGLLVLKGVKAIYSYSNDNKDLAFQAAKAAEVIRKLSYFSGFDSWNYLTDPVPVFFGNLGETCLFYNIDLQRFCLPGAWRFARSSVANDKSLDRMVFLSHRDYVFVNRRVDARKIIKNNPISEIIDSLGSVTSSYLAKGRVKRSKVEGSAGICSEKMDGCCLYQRSLYNNKGRKYYSIDFIESNSGSVEVFQIYYGNELLGEGARRILETILKQEKRTGKELCN